MKLNLSLTPGDFHKSYTVSISITNNGRRTMLEQIVKVGYVRTLSGRSRIYTVIRNEELLIDGHSPKYTVDELAADAGNVFYPLELEIGFDGKYLCVYNIDAIRERWIEKRKKLADYYIGAPFEKYLLLMDQVIFNTRELNEVFDRDFFTKVYFSALYADYPAEPEKQPDLLLSPAATITPLRFSIYRELKKDPAAELLWVIFNGVLNDPRDEWEINNGLLLQAFKTDSPMDSAVKGAYHCSYFLNAATKAIEKITATCTVDINNGCETRMELNEIRNIAGPEEHKETQQDQSTLISKFSTLLFGKNENSSNHH